VNNGRQGSHVEQIRQQEFRAFVEEVEPRLRRALVASYGFEQGREAAAEALAWAWEHWDQVKALDHQTAYLFRVGQTKSRSRKIPTPFDRHDEAEPWFEPALAPALAALSERQRVAVVLIHGFDWTMREVAELMGIKLSSVQTHLERGLRHLRNKLEVTDSA
jgi:DNA-directed RNA polymerase specialized sigma24 family protein